MKPYLITFETEKSEDSKKMLSDNKFKGNFFKDDQIYTKNSIVNSVSDLHRYTVQ